MTRALEGAARRLATDPARAAADAREILHLAPGEPRARLILAMALRRCGDPTGARPHLEQVCQDMPHSARAHIELGEAHLAMGDPAAAERALREALRLNPDSADAWRGRTAALLLSGDAPGADQARAQAIRADALGSDLSGAAQALCEGRFDAAESAARVHLEATPDDVAALRLRAEALLRLERYADAEAAFDRCLELDPAFDQARESQAIVLIRQNKAPAAIGHLRQLLMRRPDAVGCRALMAMCLDLTAPDTAS
ncbi:MAG TPA: tetratricopeptide repeat protein [Caulobacteraceae bacterium]|nr:tetratricopeptide repeat protein [Caulobacteraceae bacterium]